MGNTIIGKGRGNSYVRDLMKAHLNTQKFNWNVSTITDVFLDQKRVNVCEHTVKMASHVMSFLIRKE